MSHEVNAQADARRTGSSKNLPVERGKPSQIDTEKPEFSTGHLSQIFPDKGRQEVIPISNRWHSGTLRAMSNDSATSTQLMLHWRGNKFQSESADASWQCNPSCDEYLPRRLPMAHGQMRNGSAGDPGQAITPDEMCKSGSFATFHPEWRCWYVGD